MEDVAGILRDTKPFQTDGHDDWPAETAIDVSENVMLGVSLGFSYRYWELVDELANDCNVEVRLPDQGRRGHAGPRGNTAQPECRYKQASSIIGTRVGYLSVIVVSLLGTPSVLNVNPEPFYIILLEQLHTSA